MTPRDNRIEYARMRGIPLLMLALLASCSREEPAKQPAVVQQPTVQPAQKKQDQAAQQPTQQQPDDKKEIVVYSTPLQQDGSSSQSPDGPRDYSFEASVEIVEIGKKPHIRLKATTDLPDDSWIQCWLYSGVLNPGRHIENQSATIKEGKGEMLFRCFADCTRIPLARFVFDVHFNYEMQSSMEVQKKVKESGKSLSLHKAINWDYGTVGEQKNYEVSVRKRVFDFLSSICTSLESVASAGKKPDEVKKSAAALRDRLMGEMDKLYTSVDLKVYNLDNFAATVGEEISQLSNQCLLAVENGDMINAERLRIILNKRIALVQSRILEHSGTSDRIKDLLRECEQLIESVTDEYVQEWSGKPVKPKYLEMLMSYPDEMDKLCIELSFDCPKEAQQEVLGLRDAVSAYFDSANAAAKVKELNRAPLDEKARVVSEAIKGIISKLK